MSSAICKDISETFSYSCRPFSLISASKFVAQQLRDHAIWWSLFDDRDWGNSARGDSECCSGDIGWVWSTQKSWRLDWRLVSWPRCLLCRCVQGFWKSAGATMNLALYRRQHGVDEVPVWKQVFVSTLRWDRMLMVSDTHGVVLWFHSEVQSRRKLLLEFVKLQFPVVERLAGHADADVHIWGEKVFVQVSAPSLRCFALRESRLLLCSCFTRRFFLHVELLQLLFFKIHFYFVIVMSKTFSAGFPSLISQTHKFCNVFGPVLKQHLISKGFRVRMCRSILSKTNCFVMGFRSRCCAFLFCVRFSTHMVGRPFVFRCLRCRFGPSYGTHLFDVVSVRKCKTHLFSVKVSVSSTQKWVL